MRQNPRTMYRKQPNTEGEATGRHVPATEPTALRRLLLRAVEPDVQQLFHRFETARTPDEWVCMEVSLPGEIAQLVTPEPQEPCADGRAPWPFPRAVHCPACRTTIPEDSGTLRQQLTAHLAGSGGLAQCEVVGELQHHFTHEVRPRLFADAAVDAARERYEAAAAGGSPARNKAAKRGRDK